MSRFRLYLIYLLIYTQLVFSFDFNRGPRRDQNSSSKIKPFKKKSRLKERSRVAQFDVASFIQKPDDLEVQNLSEDAVEKRRRTSKDYDYGLLNDISSRGNKIGQKKYLDDANFDINITPESSYNALLPRDIMIENQFKLTGFDDHIAKNSQNQKYRHNLEKKCSFKNMNFPFFSRKSQNKVKEKKRKMFCFNCSKKDDGLEITTSNGAGKTVATIPAGKKNLNRSNKDRFRNNRLEDKREVSNQEIHNSRQFYQHKINNFEVTDTNVYVQGIKNNEKLNRNVISENSPSEDDLQDGFSESSIEVREKRSEMDDNDRRLKILDEIQRKVDNLEIRVPTYPKMPYETN